MKQAKSAILAVVHISEHLHGFGKKRMLQVHPLIRSTAIALLAMAASVAAQEVVIRDSIGPTSFCTDGCGTYPNVWNPNTFGFLVAEIVPPNSGTLSAYEIVVADTNFAKPTDPTGYQWRLSIWSTAELVDSSPFEPDILSTVLTPFEVSGQEWGQAIVFPTEIVRSTFRIHADLSAYAVGVVGGQSIYVALYNESTVAPFLEHTSFCESAESLFSNDLFRNTIGAFPLSDGADNQYTGRAAVRATIVAPGGGVDAEPCGSTAVPAVSEWGLVILLLTMLTIGGVSFRRAAA